MKLFELVEAYKGSLAYRELAPNSQVSYQQMIDAAYNYFSKNRKVDTLAPMDADRAYLSLSVIYGEAKAQQIMKVLKRIWNWGYRYDYIRRNPWAKMGIKGIAPRTTVWSKEEYDTVRKECTEGYSTLGMFLFILYTTGQRPVDILDIIPKEHIKLAGVSNPTGMGRLEWQLTLMQRKTGKQLILPLSEGLATWWLKEGPFLSSFRHNYHTQWATIRERVKLPHLQLRDLRRTVLTDMANGGATDAEIRAVSGHSGHSPIPNTVYVQRSAEQAAKGLAKRSMGYTCPDCGSIYWCGAPHCKVDFKS